MRIEEIAIGSTFLLVQSVGEEVVIRQGQLVVNQLVGMITIQKASPETNLPSHRPTCTRVATMYQRSTGTVAIAGAIQNKYDIPVIPHIICSGATKEDIEYELLDLQFLGISNILVLRGDKAKEDRQFTPTENGHTHATDLLKQVNQFNDGFFFDGTPIKHPGDKFCCGVACYPEKHEEAPNLEMDMQHLLEKQQLGAAYAVTQLFYDNEKFYAFVEKARQIGVTIPIIPAIKPFAKLSQLTVVPKTFHCDIPEELAQEVLKCKTDEDAKQLGIEWTTAQVQDLFEHGYKNVHFFTVSAVDSVKQIAKILF